MANLNLTKTWEPGIYQWETTDPLQGGVNGIDNVPTRQLGNRTEFLRDFADEVATARGAQESLNARLGAIEGGRGVVAQGVAVIKNKFVVLGMVLTKATDIRALHLSRSGVVGAGVSRVSTGGLTLSLADDDYHVTVPPNETSATRIYYAYFLHSQMRVEISAAVPDEGLLLYSLSIPAGDIGNSLANVTLTDLRVIQSVDSWISSFTPGVTVALPQALPDMAYAVELEVESATNPAAVGELVVYDKATNAFKIKQTGSADNVRIRWTVLKLSA